MYVMNVYSAIKMPCPGIEVRAFVCIDCCSVIVTLSSDKPEGVGGQVGCMFLSATICQSLRK